MGGSVLANQGAWGLAGVGPAGCDNRESDELFGPLWFAVPKKRVSRSFLVLYTKSKSRIQLLVCTEQ